MTVQAMRKLAIPCRHSPWAVWFDICKIAVKTAPTIAERTPYPRGSGLDREWEPNDRPGYALASDPLLPPAPGQRGSTYPRSRSRPLPRIRRGTNGQGIPIPCGSGLDREWEPSDRPGYALASDPLSPFARGGVVRHIQDRCQDRSHNSRADTSPVGAVLTANESQVDRPGCAQASDPLSPFTLGRVVRHIQDRGQDRSHNSRADAIPVERSRPRIRAK